MDAVVQKLKMIGEHRSGLFMLDRALGERQTGSYPTMSLELKPIGIVHSPFKEATGAPIQASMADGAVGTAEVFPAFADGLRDLDGFDRIWLLYWFDRAAAPRLIVTPYMDDQSHGVFATRAPARPNPIGMSAVRLLRIEGCTLHVADVDILDGTPLLDIKPYVPRFDHLPAERTGWLRQASNRPRTADRRFET